MTCLERDEMERRYFDCRRYIKPGDIIEYGSVWGCEGIETVGWRRDQLMWRGRVVKVYEKFIFVKLKNVTEGLNRWNIHTLNGRRVKNDCFYGFKEVTWT